MRSLDHDVRETDPFEEQTINKHISNEKSPYVNRINFMWEKYRKTVIALFPNEANLPIHKQKYLESMEEIYKTDAYHSLSIERYKVSEELIELVSSGEWNAQDNKDHQEFESAMATKGYYDASIEVKSSVEKILDGHNSGTVVDQDHSNWHQKLFSPSVKAGFCTADA